MWGALVLLLIHHGALPMCTASDPRNGHAEVHNALQLFRVPNLRDGLQDTHKIVIGANATKFDAAGTAAGTLLPAPTHHHTQARSLRYRGRVLPFQPLTT